MSLLEKQICFCFANKVPGRRATGLHGTIFTTPWTRCWTSRSIQRLEVDTFFPVFSVNYAGKSE